MIKRLALLTGVVLAPAPALAADRAFGAEDAVAIDWAVKNCDVKSTERTYALVDEAKAKGAELFNKQYMQHFASKDLADALTARPKLEAMCRRIKEWYGPEGSRFAKLIRWEGLPVYSGTEKTSPVAPTGQLPGKGHRR